MDFRAKERWDARKTSQNSADLRGKILRITPKLGDIPADADARRRHDVRRSRRATCSRSARRRPAPRSTRWASASRSRCTPTRPTRASSARASTATTTSSNAANRSPGRHLRVEPARQGGQPRLAVLRRQQLDGEHHVPLELRDRTRTTGQQYDCNLTSCRPTSATRPPGQTAVEPTFDGLDTLPGPVEKATIWKKYHGAADGQSPADFGDLDAGGMQPIAGPIYRYPDGTATPGRVPALLRRLVADQQPRRGQRLLEGSQDAPGQQPDAARQRLAALQRRRQPDRARTPASSSARSSAPTAPSTWRAYSVGCCRDAAPAPANQNQIVKISFNVQDECLTDTNAPNASAEVTGQAYPDRPNTYVNSAKLKLTATDSGCAGVKNIEYRQQGSTDVAAVHDRGHVRRGQGLHGRVPRDRPQGQRRPRSRRPRSRSSRSTTRRRRSSRPHASGNKDQRNYFVGSATLTLTATDNEVGGSGVQTGRVPHQRRRLDPVHRSGRLQHGRQLHGRLPRHGQGQQHVRRSSRSTFRILARRGLHAGPLGRVQRHRARLAVAASHAQRRHAARARSRSRTASCTSRRPTSSSTRPTTTTSVGPVNFIGQDLDVAGHQLAGRDRVHGQVHRRLAEHGPDRLERGQQLLPLLDHARASTAATSTSSSPRTTRPRPRARARRPAATSRSRRTRTRRSRSACATRAPTGPTRWRRSTASWLRPAIAMADWADFGGAANFLDLEPVGRRAP